MSHIFISCSHKDIDQAMQFSELLDKHGFSTWLYDRRLKGGDEWVRIIDDNIRYADAVIVVLTRISNKSPYVIYEWSLALGLDKPMIPVHFENVPKKELHDRLASLHRPQSTDLVNIVQLLEQEIAATKRHTIIVPRQAPHVIHEIAALVDNSDQDKRENGLYQLVTMRHSTDIVPLLLQALDSPLPDVQRKTIDHLQELGDRRAVPHLLKKLDDPHEWIRIDAISALGRLGDSSLVDEFLGRFGSSGPREKEYLLYALGDIRDPLALPKIVEALTEPEHDDETDTWSIRHAAERALEDYGRSVIPLIIETCISTDNESLQVRLAHVIASMCFVETENRHFTRTRKAEVVELKQSGFEALREMAGSCPAVLDTLEKWYSNQWSEQYKRAKEVLEKILFPNGKPSTE